MTRQPNYRRSNTFSNLIICVAVLWCAYRLFKIQQESELVVAERAEVQVVRVIDGDTLLIENNQRVRLLGIDTPETKHPTLPPEPFGPEATQFTTELVEGKTVELLFDKERYDDYRRILAFVYLKDGRLLNEELVLAGLATAETQYPYRSDFKKILTSAENQAQNFKRGIWSIEEN